MPVEVRWFGDQRVRSGNLTVRGFQLDMAGWNCPNALRSTLGAVRRCIDINAAGIDPQIVQCHTWYTHWGGILARKNYGIPLVITVHSLEPLRPWKREQLGGGYDFRFGSRRPLSKWPTRLLPFRTRPRPTLRVTSR